MEQISFETCPFCLGEIQYSPGATWAICPSCGEKLAVAGFISEQASRLQLQQEKEQVEKELAAAKLEEEEAQKKLSETLSQLGKIVESQGNQDKQLDKLLSDQKIGETERQALRSLLMDLNNRGDANQKVITELFRKLLVGQGTGTEKINRTSDSRTTAYRYTN